MGFTFLHGLAAAGKYDQALDEMQINENAPFVKDQWGCTPIHYSCEKNHLDITKALLSAGADLNDTDRFSHTPLLLACRESHLETIEFLISQSGDLLLANSAGLTPLHSAASSPRPYDTIRLLLEARADLFAVDGFGNSALHLSAKRGDVESARLLASEGSDLRNPNIFGNSPLDLAPDDSTRAAMTEARKQFKRSGSGLGMKAERDES